jgi:cytochrome c6
MERLKANDNNLMKRLLILVLFVLTLFGFAQPPAAATNVTTNAVGHPGAEIFEAHCAGCHINGGNIVRRGKNLKLKTLQRNQMDSIAAIAEIVTHGKNNMSAYGDRLSAPQIQDVAAYVLERAEQNWK